MRLFGIFTLDLRVVEAVVDSAIRTVVRFIAQSQAQVDKQQSRIDKAATKAKKFADEQGTASRILSGLYAAKEPLEQ